MGKIFGQKPNKQIKLEVIYFYYFISRAIIEDKTKSIDIIIVNINTVFSAPLLTCLFWEKLSTPKALPKLDSDCCKSIDPISITDNTIWTYGIISDQFMLCI